MLGNIMSQAIHTFTVLDEDLVGVGVGLAPLLGGVGGHGHGDGGAGVERSASVMQFVDCIFNCINWTHLTSCGGVN